jgi:hypothetical protein
MIEMLSIVLLLAETPAQTTLPRHPEPPAANSPSAEQRRPTDPPADRPDPLFERPLRATDDAAFLLSAVEGVRQGVIDSRAAATGLPTPELRSAAQKIGEQQHATLTKLESLAKAKGWRLPQANPDRTNTVPVSGGARTSADFIVHQIAAHQNTIEQFRAQIEGPGDAELKRALRTAVPGYEKNLQMLLGLKL